MIIRFDDIIPESVTAPRNGKGTGETFSYAKLKGVAGKFKTFNMMNLDADSAIGVHKHETDMEVYMLLDGVAKYNDNGKEETVEAGDLMICNKGQSHGLETLNNEPVTLIAFIIEN